MSVTRTAVHRPVTVFMFFVAVILFGIVSLDRLALNLLPDISYPSITIQTDYEDAAPEEIESLLTRPIEETVGVASGLTRISSVSRPGQSEVVLEFVWDTNMDLAAMDVREKLDLIQLPEDAEKPVLLRFDPSYDPILRLQLFADMSLSRLRTVADEELKKRLEAVEGVAAVKVVGGREEQIRIEIDEKRLAELGVPITEITNILRQENINQASGSLYDLDSNYLVRMLNEFRTVEEIERIVVRDQDGRRIVLGDVARVWRGVKDRGVIARYNGSESVEVAIYKEGDANTVSTAEGVLARLDQLKNEKTFPRGLDWRVVFNQAEFISQSVDNVLSAAGYGGLLAILVLIVFLRDLRSTVVIGLSIPISIMATFAAMYQTGVTLNIMSLGGVALGVGMLVDNSIVVLEAVARRRRASGDIREEAVEGTGEVALAVTASTLTTIAVFFPLVFVEGIAGQLFADQALTITYALLASLAVALTFIPMALGLRFNPEPADEGASGVSEPEPPANPVLGLLTVVFGAIRRAFRFVFFDTLRVVVADVRRALSAAALFFGRLFAPFFNAFDDAFESLTRSYRRLLESSLNNKPVVAGVVLLSVLAAGAISSGLGAELIPSLTQGEFSFEIEMPEGTPIERTDEVVRRLEESTRELETVEAVFSTVGGSQQNQFSVGSAVEENFGMMSVVMKDRRDRGAENRAIAHVRSELGDFPESSYTFIRPTLFSFKTPIEVEVFAYELEDQRAAADIVMRRLSSIEGVGDLRSTTRMGNPEIQVRFDRERLARLGLEERRIADTLRNKIRGEVASRYREGDRQIDILVRAGEQDRDAVEDIRNLVVNAPRDRNNNESQGAGGGDGSTRRSGGLSGTSSTPDNSAFAQNRNPGAGEQGGLAKPIRLGQIAEVSIARGPSEIRRVRSQRAAVISGSLTGRDLSSVSAEIRAALNEIRGDLPAAVTVGLGGQNEELETSYRSLLFALGLAVFMVYLVMASQFESLIHPFIILFSVPLALVGVVFALAATGTEVSVVALLGVIILAGIVVNNAIVLIDYANQLRRQGLSKRQALLEAGQVRLRPIAMTTLTTVLGLAPMAIGWGEGAEIRAPMAIAVMGGLTFSTLLTLVLIPVAYEVLDRRSLAGDRAPELRESTIGPDEAVQGAD